MGRAEPRVSVLEEPGAWRIGAGETGAPRAALPAFPRVSDGGTCRLSCTHDYGFGERCRCRLSDPGQKNKDRATQQLLTVPAGVGQTAPGRALSHGIPTASAGCDPPVIPELLLPREKEPRAEEEVQRPNPRSQPPRCHDLAAACREALCCVLLGAEEKLPEPSRP